MFFQLLWNTHMWIQMLPTQESDLFVKDEFTRVQQIFTEGHRNQTVS